MEYKTMNSLRKGEKAIVSKLFLTGDIRRRLQDIGLIRGTVVQCLYQSPGGDPSAYLIRGAVIALRSDDTEKIRIEKIDNRW